MNRYADPTRCPDCLEPIEYGAAACTHCDLPLEGPMAGRLFQTLSEADQILTTLRSAGAFATREVAQPSMSPVATPPLRRHDRRLSAASVPKILLSLGAICVLVAALVFLAVAWSVMGVAGRTATLVGFTVVAAALSALTARRDLRGAAESLALVALGLLTLDVFGARDSGWFGDLATPSFLVLLGAVLLIAGVGAALGVRRTRIPTLVGAETVAALGTALVALGTVDLDPLSRSAGLVLTVAVGAAISFLAYRLQAKYTAMGSAVVTAVMWLVLAVESTGRAVEHPTLRALWLELESWPLLVAAVLVGALALVRRLDVLVRLGAVAVLVRVCAVAVATLLLSTLLVLPFLQGSVDEASVAVLVLICTVGALTWFLPRPWGLSGALIQVVGSVFLLVVLIVLATFAATRFLDEAAATWTGRASDIFPPELADAPAGWLLPLTMLGILATVLVVFRAATGSMRINRLVLTTAVALVVASAVATLTLYPVPLWIVLASLLVSTSAFAGLALRQESLTSLVAAAVFASGAVVLGLHDELSSAVALTVTCGWASAVLLRWSTSAAAAASGFALAGTGAAAVWSWGALAGAEGSYVALLVIVLLGALVLGGRAAVSRLRFEPEPPAFFHAGNDWRFLGVEGGAALSMLISATLGVATAPYVREADWTAIYLTVAGALATGLALLRRDRRYAGWLGGVLLAMATWVRLWDVGIRVPEAYTLPSAVALTLVGLSALRRDRAESTMTALSPGLVLALVPSMLWVLREPLGLRAALLGAGCLALVLAGLRVRWSAPVVYAAAVGAMITLRHAAPYLDAAVPRWVMIGAAGALLIAVGTTWERRLQEARQVAGFVKDLR